MTLALRVILRVPEALTFEALSPEQQAAIASVFGQFVIPMPGTVPFGGYKLVDAITSPDFHPERMALYGMNWPAVGLWDNSGVALAPFDATTMLAHIAPTQAYDIDGNPVGEPTPPVLHEPHRWAGWPELF